MDRTTTQKEYRFDEKGHKHEFLKDGEWKPLIGVTTALSVIAKPALIQWAANMACDYIKDKALPVEVQAGYYHVTEELLKEARVAHRKKKEAAGDIGTEIHAEVESIVLEAINSSGGQIDGNKKASELVQPFINWAVENKVKFLESEKHVYSENLWIGGILDLVFEMDGKRYIGDIKTSSGIYNEMFFQMGAYDLCLEEMGYQIDGYLVINIKKTGGFDLMVAENREINKQAFLSALELYKIININLK